MNQSNNFKLELANSQSVRSQELAQLTIHRHQRQRYSGILGMTLTFRCEFEKPFALEFFKYTGTIILALILIEDQRLTLRFTL